MNIARIVTLAALLSAAAATSASALDWKGLKELIPCKAAALRMCDRSGGISAASLWKCGATLASRQQEVGQRCIEVLKRYGQL